MTRPSVGEATGDSLETLLLGCVSHTSHRDNNLPNPWLLLNSEFWLRRCSLPLVTHNLQNFLSAACHVSCTRTWQSTGHNLRNKRPFLSLSFLLSSKGTSLSSSSGWSWGERVQNWIFKTISVHHWYCLRICVCFFWYWISNLCTILNT